MSPSYIIILVLSYFGKDLSFGIYNLRFSRFQVNEELSASELKALLALAKREIVMLKKRLQEGAGSVTMTSGGSQKLSTSASDDEDGLQVGHS